MIDMSRRGILSLGAVATLTGAAAAAAAPPSQSKRLSASEFGVVGDGATDDTQALQTALNAAFAGRDGGLLTIPPGVYRVTRTLRVETQGKPAGNVTHRAGILAQGVVLQSEIADGGPVLEIVSRAVIRYVLIEGLQIQGNGREGVGLSINCEQRGCYFYNFCLRDIVAQGCGGDGLSLIGNVFEGQIFNCYFRDNKGNGAVFGHGKEDTVLSAVHVYGSVFGQNDKHGAALVNGAYDVAFHGCYFLLNAEYGMAAGMGCTLLTNCGFENNHAKAQGFDKGGAGVRLKIFGTLVGCTAYSIYNQTHLLDAYVTNRLVLVGCTASGGGKAQGAKLVKLDGKREANVTVIGCSGGVDSTDAIDPLVLGGGQSGARFGEKWDGPNLARLGEYRLWVDAEGQLRIKKGNPSSDGDGRRVGS